MAVLSLGGTISSTGTGGRSVEPTLSGEDLVANVPQIAEVADVSPESFRQAASGELTLDDLIEVAEEIERRIDGGASGVVVTQGTDSIEETSLVLDLLVDREAPVVVIGAMRNPDLPGADGPANLLASVAVAESGAGLGHARRAQRGDPHRPLCSQDPYPKPGRFPLGTGRSGELALGGRSAHFATRPSGRRHVALRPGGEDRPVALFTVALGDDGRLLLKISELGYEGLVIEALGGGHVPSVMVEPLAALDREMPVVLASRTGSGEVLRRTYGYPGSETDLLNRGLISAGSLDGFKARLLLSLLLRSGAGREKTEDLFGNWLGHRC